MNLIKRTNRDWLDPLDLIEEDFNSLVFAPLGRLRGMFTPEVELSEDENRYLVRAEVPGMKKEELEISFSGNVLTLKGEKKEETQKKDKHFYHSERRFGSFERRIELAGEVDTGKVKAVLTEGVLELTIPKSERAKPKQIKVDIQ